MKQQLADLIEQALTKLDITDTPVSITLPKERKFGDYATNVALQLNKKLGKTPAVVAQEILDAMPANTLIQNTEIVAPGFINFFLEDRAIAENFGAYQLSAMALGEGKTAITDSSNPNIAKPMGIHHLLSTIIGDALNKMLAYAGYQVIRDNFIGDVGTQFGKLIYAYKTWGDPKTIEADPIPELLKLYVRFHEEVETNPALEDEGRREFKKLEDHDPENHKLWQWMVELSLKDFQKIYHRLDITFDLINGESFYEDKMAAILEQGKAKSVFTAGEKGALVCQFPEEILPTCVIQKSDGATMYHTRDLARIAYWEKTYHPDLMINVVDVAQELHFKQLFAISAMLELTDAQNVHVSFGRMQFKDRKMSTRKGNILLLGEVLDEAIKRSKELFQEKGLAYPAEEQNELAEIIGMGAIKYAVLSQNRNTNIIFEWDKIISLEGNSGPYLQYTYTRAKSIMEKTDAPEKGTLPAFDQLEIEERELCLHLFEFHDCVRLACTEYKPNLLANYLFQLSQLFNGFYNKIPVLKAPEDKKQFRLKLVLETCKILKLGLGLLGIRVPERM